MDDDVSDAVPFHQWKEEALMTQYQVHESREILALLQRDYPLFWDTRSKHELVLMRLLQFIRTLFKPHLARDILAVVW